MALPWYLEIVHVSNAQKQQDLLTLLHDVANVTALGSTNETDHYVVFECPDRRLALAIEKLFAEVDPSSTATFASSRTINSPSGGGAA